MLIWVVYSAGPFSSTYLPHLLPVPVSFKLRQELSSSGGAPECTEHPLLALLDFPEALVFPLCPFAVCLLWGQGRGSCMAHRHLTFASGTRVLTVVKRQLKQAWTENALQPPTPACSAPLPRVLDSVPVHKNSLILEPWDTIPRLCHQMWGMGSLPGYVLLLDTVHSGACASAPPTSPSQLDSSH